MNKQRLEAFSDGVFAIVITLLILDIKIPNVEPTALLSSLVNILPQVLTYVMSFFIVGLYWHLHHQVAAQIKQIDEPFVWLNLVWLLFVSVLPFPTSLLGRYPLQPISLAIYGANLILVNVTGFLILVYFRYHPNLRFQPMSSADLRAIAPVYVIVNGLYLIAIAVAWFFPWMSYGIYSLVLIWVITRSIRRVSTIIPEETP
ncbi:MAG TPA: TMEM175 family protein [Anaerolineales bacterium]|nr:TMEM175 family protein [Anaerolineales bacterium]